MDTYKKKIFDFPPSLIVAVLFSTLLHVKAQWIPNSIPVSPNNYLLENPLVSFTSV